MGPLLPLLPSPRQAPLPPPSPSRTVQYWTAALLRVRVALLFSLQASRPALASYCVLEVASTEAVRVTILVDLLYYLTRVLSYSVLVL